MRISFLFLQEVVLSVMCETGEILDGFDALNTEGAIIYAWNYCFSPSSGNANVCLCSLAIKKSFFLLLRMVLSLYV